MGHHSRGLAVFSSNCPVLLTYKGCHAVYWADLHRVPSLLSTLGPAALLAVIEQCSQQTIENLILVQSQPHGFIEAGTCQLSGTVTDSSKSLATSPCQTYAVQYSPASQFGLICIALALYIHIYIQDVQLLCRQAAGLALSYPYSLNFADIQHSLVYGVRACQLDVCTDFASLQIVTLPPWSS